VARFETVDVCKECGSCGGTRCAPVREPHLRSYDGIRFTADGFDCALPVSIDSHSHCSYGCLYCFSDSLVSHAYSTGRPVGQIPLSQIERILAGEGGKRGASIRQALRYDSRINGYPCAVQLGALNDPCDHIERNQGWLLQFIDLAIKYRQPVRISTKGTTLALPEYQRAMGRAPELFWVAFSIISPDDELMARLDRRAPSPTERLATMATLSHLGVKTALRLRPMMPGASDATPKHPRAYKELIERATAAGARAISTEVVFLPGAMAALLKSRWATISSLLGIDMRKMYGTFGPSQSCTRPAYTWTENLMHRVVESAHENGLTVGVSDPVWKQLGDTGCCCGILPDDPVFGNWQRESATNQFLIAKATGKEICAADVIPAWAYSVKLSEMVNLGTGPKNMCWRLHATWADKLYKIWNDVGGQRSPLNYFQGALMPTRSTPDKGLYYKYVGLQRHYPQSAVGWSNALVYPRLARRDVKP